jgi:hypothetical protein
MSNIVKQPNPRLKAQGKTRKLKKSHQQKKIKQQKQT